MSFLIFGGGRPILVEHPLSTIRLFREKCIRDKFSIERETLAKRFNVSESSIKQRLYGISQWQETAMTAKWRPMGRLISGISDFISKVLALLAGEVRLAALRKASHGSSRLSGFIQRITKTKAY